MKAQVEKSGLNGFERLLVIVLIPTAFTIILIVVLFSLIDKDLFNDMQRQAHQIPVIGSFVPEPKQSVDNPDKAVDSPTDKLKLQNQRIVELNQKLADQLTTINNANTASLEQKQTIQDLQAQITALTEQLKTKTSTDAEYEAQVQKTAQMYANMEPSKAALILDNLTLEEQVLIFSEMKQLDQVKILEKMDPLKAAQASIALKDIVTAKDREIAALQDRIKLNDSSLNSIKLTKNDIGQTFANMTPKSAATVLLQMQSITPSKVIDILSAMATQPRSLVLSALADLSKETAAAISAKLAP